MKVQDDFIDYGVTSGFFAVEKPRGMVVAIGGQAGEARWTRLLTRRVAHTLWFHLTFMLFPERSKEITTRAATAPIRGEDEPTLATNIEVFRGEGGLIEIMGTGGQVDWMTRGTEHDIRALWQALDKVLFPLGWQGGQQTTPGSTSR